MILLQPEPIPHKGMGDIIIYWYYVYFKSYYLYEYVKWNVLDVSFFMVWIHIALFIVNYSTRMCDSDMWVEFSRDATRRGREGEKTSFALLSFPREGTPRHRTTHSNERRIRR